MVIMENTRTEQRIRRASILIAAGLLVQLGTLSVNHPLAFMGFVLLGCPLLGTGIILYLLSLLPGG